MTISFGTSGLRGPAEEFLPDFCSAYVTSFLEYCGMKTPLKTVYLAADLRESSPRIAAYCMTAARTMGWTAVWAGNVPTPALAAYAMLRMCPSIMITGSHIPEAFNGIKFYRPDSEFLKSDEASVHSRAEELLLHYIPEKIVALGLPLADVAASYVDRYIKVFGNDLLAGIKVGIDLHSAVGRDLTVEIITRLGAQCSTFNYIDGFVAVDTEALDKSSLDRSRALIADNGLDAIVSTDGDGDRPLVISNAGRQINGDILGMLTAKFIGAKVIVTPISSSTVVIPPFLTGFISRI